MTQDGTQPPDIHSDIFNILVNAVGVNLVLARTGVTSEGKPGEHRTVAVVRMSLENWKAMLMTGRRQLKDHEKTQGIAIQLPKPLLDSLGLTEAEW